MYAVIPDDDLEMQLLSVFARTARQGVDRRANVGAPVDHGTGLPTSANDLLPRYKAVTGTPLALQLIVIPRQLAAAMLRRPVPIEQHPEGHIALGAIAADQWTRDEAELVAALEEQIKLKVHRMAEQEGVFNVAPEEYEPGKPLLGEDGLTCGFKITHKGLMHALNKTRGTKYEVGPMNPENDLGKNALDAVAWAQTDLRKGA